MQGATSDSGFVTMKIPELEEWNMRKIRYYIHGENEYKEVSYEEYKSYEKSRLEGQPVYAIRIGDAVMEVQKEAYMEFCRARSREKYLLRMAAIYREIPYSNLDTDGMLGEDMLPDESVYVEEEAINNILIKRLRDCIGQLPEEDREFIKNAYFDGMSERVMAKSYGISQPAIHKRKSKILLELKKFMEI